MYFVDLLVFVHRTAILERCLRRLEFDKARDAEAKAQADQLEAERMAMQSIDWYAPTTVTAIRVAGACQHSLQQAHMLPIIYQSHCSPLLVLYVQQDNADTRDTMCFNSSKSESQVQIFAYLTLNGHV